MKKVFKLSLLILSFLFILTACGNKEVEEETTAENTTQKPAVSETTSEETSTTTEAQTTTTTKAQTTTTAEAKKEIANINVSCSSKTSDGKLLTKCAATNAGGQNLVPSISWTAVDGAKAYAVYMIDESASNWLHLKTVTTSTSIKEGETITGQYIGPYPPSGTHTYVIYVVALTSTPSTLPGNFNSTNNSFSTIISKLDILAQGQTSVTYANGDNNL